jgi:LacI family fructose operon transcriptional repressor
LENVGASYRKQGNPGLKLSDIARLAGVSVTTASYVINGKAEQQRISNATVERVRAGGSPWLHPQPPGRRAAQSAYAHLGLHPAGSGKPQLRAHRQAAGTRRARARLSVADRQFRRCADSERQLLQLFRARRCDALFVASCLPASDDSYRELQAKGLPVIAIDRVMEPEHFCSVISDDREASLQLTSSLLPLPKQIVLIGARPELSISQERAAGFAKHCSASPAKC